MKALLAPLAELADYEEIRKNRTKENGMIQISGCVNTQKIHLLSGIGSGCGYKLVVFQMRKRQRRHTKSIYCLEKRRICILQEICFFIMRILKGRHLQIEEWKC